MISYIKILSYFAHTWAYNEQRRFRSKSHLFFEAVESDHSNECHLVSAENYHFLNLEFPAKEEIFEKLRVMAQKWIGDVVEV